MDYRRVFAANLQRLRREQGFSQEALADEAGVESHIRVKAGKCVQLGRTGNHGETGPRPANYSGPTARSAKGALALEIDQQNVAHFSNVQHSANIYPVFHH
jgi:transcriptional regulator with XRE-family HTH domain